MSEILDAVAAAARRNNLFDGVSRLLVGCSGGGDSVALLDLLARLADDFGLTLAAAHLHHGWRGAEADQHQQLAAELGADRGVPFFARRVELGGATGSREEAARSARLAFFAELAREWGADGVALGHTADDQLETVVLHLARGAGRRGLGGMRRRAQVNGLLLLRPLLDVRRAELRAYAAARDLRWGEDSSNDDISLARNRLRRRLLADLQQINPGAVDNVARAAGLLQEEEEWLDRLAAEALDGLRVEERHSGGLAVHADRFAELPPPLQRRVVRSALGQVRGHCRGIAHEHVEWVLAGGHESARDLPGVRVRREGGAIRFLPLVDRRLAGGAES